MHDILDISPPLSPELPVWPGDRPFRRELTVPWADGAGYELGAMRASLHAGAHADAPAHFLEGAASIDCVPLSPYVGRCRVIRARGVSGLIRAEDLDADLLDAPRVLLRTDACVGRSGFCVHFPSLDGPLVDLLRERGVRLVGVDTPSVDACAAKELRIHRHLAESGIAILENLRLNHVEPGPYFLVAPPLRIVHGDGSPVRALLLPPDWKG
jgi:arylformamidase